MVELNRVYNENCIETTSRMPDGFIDMTLTSPPYDQARNYKVFDFDFPQVARELLRVTKDGGTVVWVVGDSTIKGSETGTSFAQALYFKEIGFNILDTMIYHKRAVGSCGSPLSYNQAFEYMFVFTKGKIKTFNPIKDLVSSKAGMKTTYAATKSNKDGYLSESVTKVAPDSSKRQNVWTYDIGFAGGGDKTDHPAVFPEQLATDHIISWSNKNDVIYDCFMGSGTVAKCCKMLGRNYIGSEISKEYCDIIEKRLAFTTLCWVDNNPNVVYTTWRWR